MKLPKKIGLIWSQSFNGVIGRDGKIPDEFLSDLQHFKNLTINQTVVMGRKTWESLPIKPLPNRVNIVLTSDVDYQVPEGVQVIHSLEGLEVTTEYLYFIGGTKVLELGYPLANEIYITVNKLVCEGDTFAPVFPELLYQQEGWSIKSSWSDTSEDGLKSNTKFFYVKTNGEDNV